ncbi:hypothetical protein INT45_010205 [Circinella minor]|uniref:MI domain-containing protein n=1 Tax=Circinella minor TaxID=1195481 RepID=A0A8H7VLB7_9FUNG|nr:hypothetical protein INT45_010205 [Circinella minor]
MDRQHTRRGGRGGSRGGFNDRKNRHDPNVDDRKFSNKFINKVANRKELRKQKRLDKGKRKAAHQAGITQPAKRQKSDNNNNTNQQNTVTKGKKNQSSVEKSTKEKQPPPTKKSVDDDTDASKLKRLSKSNPQLASLLEADNLINNSKETNFADDDRDIAYWEKKLGVNNKKSGSGLKKALEDDGLFDLLGGLGDEMNKDDNDDEMDDQEYLRQKREKKKIQDMETKGEKAMDDLFAGFDESEEEEDEEEEEEDMLEDDEELLDEEMIDENDSENDEDMSEEYEDMTDPEEEEEKEIKEEKQKSMDTPKASVATKYVPPHLRKAPTTKSEQQIRLHRLLQGQLNRLSESNIEAILLQIEECYDNYPRHDVTSTITSIILDSIAQKSNLLDSFVVSYATIVSGIYRLKGVDCAAFFVQSLVETFEKEYKKCQEAVKRGETLNDEVTPGAREAKNLLTLLLELYNFQVVSCVLVYDVIRVLISELDEYSVELLLKVVKTAGPILRTDDPAALKDIIDEIQKETAKRDPKSISTRHKFMLETLANIKNNKIKNGPTSSGQADKELVMKMKRFLNGLDKKRNTATAEPLRVSLEDIHQIETKGKWWLVGASWKDNLVGTESKNKKPVKMAKDLKKDQSMQAALLKLARKQGMNTDIRRSIFITTMSAEDYLDAFEKLMKLGLSEVQQREIARVLLKCTGNEKTFNPYYMLVAKRLCEYNHSFKVTFQYCLWDFLRECGEQEVGGLERSMIENMDTSDGSTVRTSRIVNIAKFYAALIAHECLSLALLRSVNFMTLGQKGRLWHQMLFINIFIQLKNSPDSSIVNVFNKIVDMRTLAQGILFFLQESVVHSATKVLGENNKKDIESVKRGCKIAKDTLSRK